MTDAIKSFFSNNKVFYIVIFIIMLVQVFPFGFDYIVIADDWFAYGLLSTYQNDLMHAINLYSLYGFRPLAWLNDLIIVAPLWPNLAYALLALTIMRFVSIVLLDRILTSCEITWGRIATVFFAFFPTLTEATYWINAATRIVGSSFFAILAIFLLLKYIDKSNIRQNSIKLQMIDTYNSYSIFSRIPKNFYLATTLFFGVIAQGFYEQTIIFSFVLTLGVLLLRRNDIKNKLLYIIPFANLTIIGTYYFLVRNVGYFSDRGSLNLNIFARFSGVTAGIIRTFIYEQVPTVTNTISWGLSLLLNQYTILFVIIAIFAVILAIFTVMQPKKRSKSFLSLVVAIILAVCTLSIYFILEDNWVWVRNFYFALIGLAILMELSAKLLLKICPEKITKRIIFAFAVPTIFLALSGFTLELVSLRAVEYNDNRIVLGILDKMETWEISNDSSATILLFNAPSYHQPQINPRISSLASVDWAINAQIRGIIGSREHPWVLPVEDGSMINLTTTNFIIALDENFSSRQLHFDGEYLLFSDTNEIFGILELFEEIAEIDEINENYIFRRL
ncbi:MAG: hypothetical protein FWG64_00500 [Firmicutes bacterium]|nr:hypothetical protein [Bacillota bacterium]